MINNREDTRVFDKWVRMWGILLAALFLVAGSIFAQQNEQSRSHMSVGDIVANMKGKLNLTDEQVGQITPLIEENIQQRQSIMEQAKNDGSDSDAVKGQMAALRQSMESKLSQYLTSEQLEKWKNSIQQRHPRGKGHRMGVSGGGGSLAAGSTSDGGQ